MESSADRTYSDSDSGSERFHGLATIRSAIPCPDEDCYPCEYCDRFWGTLLQLDNHLISHHQCEPGRYSCPGCPRHFSSRVLLLQHQNHSHDRDHDHADPDPESVVGFDGVGGEDLSSSGNSSSAVLALGLGSASGPNPSSSHNNNNSNHSTSGGLTGLNGAASDLDLAGILESGRRYNCEHCPKIFSDPSNLQRHIRSNHVGARAHACTECGKTFATSSGLKQHTHIHSSVKPFQCEVCLKAYTQFSNLCRHKRMHADCRMQIRCPRCGQAFSTVTSLTKHRRFCDSASAGATSAPVGTSTSLATPTMAHHHSQLSSSTPGYPAPPTLPPHLAPNPLLMYPRPTYPLYPNLYANFNANLAHTFNLNNFLPNFKPEFNLGMHKLYDKTEKNVLTPTTPPPREADLVNPRSTPEMASPREEKGDSFKRTRSPEITGKVIEESTAITTNNPKIAPVTTSPKPSPKRPETDSGPETGSAAPKKSKTDEQPLDLSVANRSPLVFHAKGKPKREEEEDEEVDSDDNISILSHGSSRNSSTPTPNLQGTSSEPKLRLLRTCFSDHDQDDTSREPPKAVHAKSNDKEASRLNSPIKPSPISNSAPFFPPASASSLLSPTLNPLTSHPSAPMAYPRPFHPLMLDAMYRLDRPVATPNFYNPYGATGTLAPSMMNPRYPLFNPLFNGFNLRTLDFLHRQLPPGLSKPYEALLNVPTSTPGGLKGLAAAGNGMTPAASVRDRYSCKFCGKVFPRSANLTRHLRTHTGEQPYKCKYCERSFSISSNLQRHVRNIHNKEKPFRCPLCDRCFGQQTNLDRHLKKHEMEGQEGMDHGTSASPGSSVSGEVTSPAGSFSHEDKTHEYFEDIRNFVGKVTESARSHHHREDDQDVAISDEDSMSLDPSAESDEEIKIGLPAPINYNYKPLALKADNLTEIRN